MVVLSAVAWKFFTFTKYILYMAFAGGKQENGKEIKKICQLRREKVEAYVKFL